MRGQRRDPLATDPALHNLYLRCHLLYPQRMRSRTPSRKLLTETQLYLSAQRALMRRAHSVSEMKQHLERRAENKDLIPAVIARLRELNYLDDAKYALNYAAQHAKLRRQGRFRIARELRARGVPDRHIESAVDAVFADTDEAALVRARLTRRLAHLRGPLDQKKIASLYRNLLGAGFSSEIIRAELKGITHGDLPELADTAASELSEP
jgi:regulatory protein